MRAVAIIVPASLGSCPHGHHHSPLAASQTIGSVEERVDASLRKLKHSPYL
jgi:hypothetical protein